MTNLPESRSLRNSPSDRSCRGVVLAALAGLLLASTAAAQVTLFEHKDFRGRSTTLYEAHPNLRGSYVGNDRASSIAVAPGCTAVLYRDSNFRGPAVEVRGDVSRLGRTAVGNDHVSSVDVICRGQRGRRYDRYDRSPRYGNQSGYDRYGREQSYRQERYRTPTYDRHDRGRSRQRSVGLHRNDRYSGRTIWVSGPIANLRRTHLGNDELTSVTVPRGCRVTLFADSEFRGRSLVLYEDVPNLRYTRIGNDRVSSVDVDCR